MHRMGMRVQGEALVKYIPQLKAWPVGQGHQRGVSPHYPAIERKTHARVSHKTY